MFNLNFFFVIEINLLHKAAQQFTIANEYIGQSELALSSDPYDNDLECSDACAALMESKAEFLSLSQDIHFTYQSNPRLTCPEDEQEFLDMAGFAENSIVVMNIDDANGDWIMRASVNIFTVDLPSYTGTLH